MDTLEMLVKLASFGTSGVCILAVFIVGKYILALPKDSPSWKVSLMRRYQNMCIIIAVISFLAGGVNAYFNQNKIATANQNAEDAKKEVKTIKEQYQSEQKKSEEFRVNFSDRLEKLQQQIVNNPRVSEETKANLNNLTIQAREFRIKPIDKAFQTNTSGDSIQK